MRGHISSDKEHMPYQIWKDKKTWRLVFVPVDHGKPSADKPRSISKDSDEAKALGFTKELSVEQARNKIKTLQASEELKRHYARQAKSAARLKVVKLIESASLPVCQPTS